MLPASKGGHEQDDYALGLDQGMRGIVQQHGDGATGESRLGGIRAAGEDGGNARAEDDAGQPRAARVCLWTADAPAW